MSLADKPEIAALLSTLAATGAMLPFGPGAVAMAALSGGAGTALIAGVKHFPEVFRSDPIQKINGIYRVANGIGLEWSEEKARIYRKMDQDFSQSPLPGQGEILFRRKDISKKASVFAERSTKIISDLDGLNADGLHISFSSAAWGQPDRESLRVLRALAKPIKASCTVIEPAILVSLFHMRERFELPIEIDFDDINGLNQTQSIYRRLCDGTPYDIAVTANAPLISSHLGSAGYAPRDHYTLLLPVLAETQYVIRPRFEGDEKYLNANGEFENLYGIQFVNYLDESSCQEQYLELRAQILGATDIPRQLSDLVAFSSVRGGDEALVIYDPLASRLVKEGLYRKIAKTKYELWVSLFGHDSFVSNSAVASAVTDVFTAAWTYCKRHAPYARTLLTKDAKVTEAFRRAVLLDPHNSAAAL